MTNDGIKAESLHTWCFWAQLFDQSQLVSFNLVQGTFLTMLLEFGPGHIDLCVLCITILNSMAALIQSFVYLCLPFETF